MLKIRSLFLQGTAAEQLLELSSQPNFSGAVTNQRRRELNHVVLQRKDNRGPHLGRVGTNEYTRWNMWKEKPPSFNRKSLSLLRGIIKSESIQNLFCRHFYRVLTAAGLRCSAQLGEWGLHIVYLYTITRNYSSQKHYLR